MATLIDQNTNPVNSQLEMKHRLSRPQMQGKILDATDRLLARYGYRKMTIDDLAREVGIGKGSIYLHFRSKEEVVYAHIDRVIQCLLQRLKAIAETDISPEEKIRKMIVLRVMFRFDSVQHFPESLSDMFRDLRPEIHRRRQNHFKEEARLVAAVLKEGQRRGTFRSGDCRAFAHAILAATNSFLPFHLSTRELGKRGELERAVTRVCNLLLEGIIARNLK